MIPLEYKGNVEIGKIIFGKHCIVGANSVVLPNVIFNHGASLGALSLAKNNLEAWSLYAGIPSKKIKNRNKEQILKYEKEFKEKN